MDQLNKWMAVGASQFFFPVGVGVYRWARGKSYQYQCSNGLELDILVETCV